MTDSDDSALSWLRWFFIWVLLNVGPVWYTIYANKKVKPAENLDPKYRPFARFDYKYWSYFTVFFTHFFFIPRYIICWLLWFTLCVITFIVLLGHK